ncbi:MAG: PEGA domain-containing protein [Kofleriaceae bacterium]
MTTGAAPLYLVSACASAEEFVAAFRRYADRTGLFVPIAEPLPSGRRGHVAITLKDGRIVLEGEVEVAASSPRPSPLYGRIGMTLKFVEPDAPTRTALGELERARLAMKPLPLSVAPRAGDVPAEPRPTPPRVGGRIDAANALAECVAIGDLADWTIATAPSKTSEASSGKFVIPAIPQLGARPKSPSVPPALQPKLAAEPKPPPLPEAPPIVVPPKPSSKAEQRMTTMGMPAIDRTPAFEPNPDMPAISATSTIQGVAPVKDTPLATTTGMPPVARPPSEHAAVVPRRDPTPLPKKGESITIPKREPSIGKQTTLGMPIVRLPATMAEPATPPATSSGVASSRRTHTPSTPPAPRHPTPYTPLPIVRMPASEPLAALVDLAEPTDVTRPPEPPLVGEEQRKTSLGVSMLTASPVASVESGWDDAEPSNADELASPVAPSRSGGLRASEIMAAMQGEDWTMTPDASSPTVLPKPADVTAIDPDGKTATEKSGPLPGDWAISLDPASPGGWSAPVKVEKPPDLKAPAIGNRNIAIASAKAIEAVEWEDKPTGIGEALVQIDPTLLVSDSPPGWQPIDVLDDEAVNIVSTKPADVPPPLAAMPPPLPFATSLPLAAHAPSPTAQPPALPPPPLGPPPRLPTPPPLPSPLFAPTVAASSAVFPAPPKRADSDGNASLFRDRGEVPHDRADPTDSIATKRRKRTMVLVLVAAVLAVLATVLVIVSTGSSKRKPALHVDHGSAATAATGSGSAALVPAGSGSAQISEGSAQVETPPPPADAAVVAPQLCSVEITTIPSGAELALDDKTVLGTSPATVQLPCGVETKIYAKKARYGTSVKAFTPSTTHSKLALRIAPPMFQIKIISVPSGATITIGNRVVGITPTTLKVQAFASTTITLTKDGFVRDTEKIAPRANNQSHHVTLKRATRRSR